jgi:hypothetical protein
VNQDSTWSQQSVIDWYGPGQRPHYGAVLASGRNSDVDAGQDLLRLAGDALYPANVLATALSGQQQARNGRSQDSGRIPLVNAADAGERLRPMVDAHWQACAANPASAAERKAEQSVAQHSKHDLKSLG